MKPRNAIPLIVAGFAAMPVLAANPFMLPRFPLPSFPQRTWRVSQSGVPGRGLTNETPAIDQAIAECGDPGGGVGFFPPGEDPAASVHRKRSVAVENSPGLKGQTMAEQAWRPPGRD